MKPNQTAPDESPVRADGGRRPTWTPRSEIKVSAPDEATKVYRQILTEIGKYLDDMEVPRNMIDAMVATNSAEIRWVASDKDGLERPPSVAEWVDAACGYTTQDENKAARELRSKS
jgi:hypothetical protein